MPLLYEHPLSPYAQKCKIALREKGVPFEARLPVGLGAGAGFERAFLEASPRGEVPALVDGEARIFDSTIILDYVEDRWPDPPLDQEMQWPGTELQRSEWFIDVQQSVIERRFTMSARHYVGHLSTVSAYLELPTSLQEQVYSRIAAVLPDAVDVTADIIVHLARRRSEP